MNYKVHTATSREITQALRLNQSNQVPMASQIALITGVSGGIGHATAKFFIEKGYVVIGIDQTPPKNSDLKIDFHQVDLSNVAEIESFASNLTTKYDHLNVLINNAGITMSKSIQDTTVEDFDRLIAINTRAPFILCKTLHPLLKRAKGSAIVNVASVHAVCSADQIAAYAASKGAVAAMTRALAIEFAKDEIRVNGVLPGAVDTPMLRDRLATVPLGVGGDVEAAVADFGRKAPVGRVAQPTDIASAIHFLADCSHSPFVTGQNLLVDGGVTARLSTE